MRRLHCSRPILRVALLATVMVAALASRSDAKRPTPAPAGAPTFPDSTVASLSLLTLQGHLMVADSVAAAILARTTSAAADLPAITAASIIRARWIWNRKAYRDSAGTHFAERAFAAARAQTPPDTLSMADAELWRGRMLWEQDRADSGAVALERSLALRTARLGARDTLVGEVWFELGELNLRRGRAELAIPDFDSAYAIQAAALGADGVKSAQTLGQHGVALMDLRRYGEARPLIERAVTAIEQRGGRDAYLLQFPLLARSRLEEETGNLALGVDDQQRALDVVARRFPTRPIATAPMHGNLGILLLELGDPDGARREFERAYASYARAFGEAHSATLQVRSYLGVAEARRGDAASAWPHLRAAERGFEASDEPPGEELVGDLHWQAVLFRESARPDSARATLAHALALVDSGASAPTDLVVELHRLGLDLALDAHDPKAIAAAVRGLTALLARPGVRETPAQGELLLARSRGRDALGERDSAWADALAAEAMARAQLIVNARALPDRQALALAQSLDDPAAQLVRLTRDGDASRIATAWSRIAAWRGCVADEIARRRAGDGAPGADPGMLAAHARWVAAEREFAQLQVNGARNGRDARWQEAFDAARSAADDAERHDALLAQVALPADPQSPLPIERVTAALGMGDVLVAFAADRAPGGHLVAFVGTRGRAPVRVDLGALAPIERALARWRRALSTPPGASGAADEAQVRALGMAVRRAVWDPWRTARAGIRRVDLVEDGPLAGTPWAALPDGEGYLVEHGPLVDVLASERRLLEPPVSPAHTLLAVGGPDFDAQGPAASAGVSVSALLRGAASDCTGLPGFPPLPGSAREASDVAARWRARAPGDSARLLVGAEATEAAFAKAAVTSGTLHLATHGVVLADSCAASLPGTRGVGGIAPIGSGAAHAPAAAFAEPAAPAAVPAVWIGRRVWLALAGANHPQPDAEGYDGVLTAEDVVTLNLRRVDRVVLSACHSAAGEQWSREGASGMQRAFLLAGARTVVASQWSIADDATGAWMSAFYSARGTVAEAMASASRAVLASRRARHRSTHPFWWAAFTATGR